MSTVPFSNTSDEPTIDIRVRTFTDKQTGRKARRFLVSGPEQQCHPRPCCGELSYRCGVEQIVRSSIDVSLYTLTVM